MFLCKFTNHISKPLNKAWKSFIKNCPVGRTQVPVPGQLALSSRRSKNAEPRHFDISPIRWRIVRNIHPRGKLLDDGVWCRGARNHSTIVEIEGKTGRRDWFADCQPT